jgi:hypothetical protein
MGIEIRGLGALVVTGLIIVLLITACDSGREQPQPDREVSDKRQQDRQKPDKGESDEVDNEARLLAEGKKGWRPCGTCHCATDPGIKEDEDWVLLNEETTCIEAGRPAPRLRKSIIAYLRHPETLRPELVDRNYKPAEGEKTGEVLVPAASGSAHLKAGRESVKKGTPSMVRLYWHETGDEKSMAVPAGDYIVVNYWLYHRNGENGKERWMATGTNVDGCTELNVETGEEAYFDLGSYLEGKFTSMRREGGFALSFSLYDIWGNRVTLSKNGRIIMPGYRILDGEEKILAEGKFSVI